MEVGNIVDLQVRINHAVFWVLPHSSRAYLVEAVRCLCQDTVTQLFLRIPVFQTAYGISAQGCIQNLVGADHATRIAFGKAEVDCDPREPKSISFIDQGDATVGVRRLLCMVVEGVSSVAISDQEAGLARPGHEPIAYDLQEVQCTGGCAVENVHDVGAKMVRLGTDMGNPDRLRD